MVVVNQVYPVSRLLLFFCPNSCPKIRYSLVPNLPLCHNCYLAPLLFYPKPPNGILAHPIQDGKKWLIIRAGFHPNSAFHRQAMPTSYPCKLACRLLIEPVLFYAVYDEKRISSQGKQTKAVGLQQLLDQVFLGGDLTDKSIIRT
jgi:hypothetical protein